MNKTWIVRSLSLLLAMIMVFGNAVTAAAASELAPSAENAIAESAQDETEETEGSAEAKPAGAENTAEVTKEAADADEAAELIGQMEGVSDIAVTADTLTATQGEYRIEAILTPEEGDTGTYVDEQINIYLGDGEAIYQLHTGSYIKEGAR